MSKYLKIYQAGKSDEEIARANAALNEFKSVFIKAHRSQKLNQGWNSTNVYEKLTIIIVLKGPYSQKFLGSVPLMGCLKIYIGEGYAITLATTTATAS